MFLQLVVYKKSSYLTILHLQFIPCQMSIKLQHSQLYKIHKKKGKGFSKKCLVLLLSFAMTYSTFCSFLYFLQL